MYVFIAYLIQIYISKLVNTYINTKIDHLVHRWTTKQSLFNCNCVIISKNKIIICQIHWKIPIDAQMQIKFTPISIFTSVYWKPLGHESKTGSREVISYWLIRFRRRKQMTRGLSISVRFIFYREERKISIFNK